MKVQYVIDLDKVEAGDAALSDYTVRPVTPFDIEILAKLMLDAYRDTVDYEQETLDDARAEVADFFDSDPLHEHSRIVLDKNTAISACLVNRWGDEGAFVGYVMTDPGYKGRGIGTACVADSLQSLALAGERLATLFITEGNTPSERLFEHLGARRVD